MKKLSLDASLKSVIRDTVDQKIAELEAVKEDGGGNGEDIFLQSPLKPDDDAKSILSSFPASEGYYGKIYKRLPDGSMELKDYTIENLEAVPHDPEIELKNIVRMKDWGPGKYILDVRNYDKKKVKGFARRFFVQIGEPTEIEREEARRERKKFGIDPPTQSPPSPASDAKTMFESVIDRSMSMAKQMTPAIDLSSMGKTISDVFVAGVNAGKGSSSSDGNKNTVVEVITVLKDAGLLTPPKPADEISTIEKVMRSMKELGIFEKKPEVDIFSQIKLLRELGIIPPPRTGDEVDSGVEKLKTLMELVTTMMPAFSGEKVSPLVEAIRIIGPHVPKMAENVTKAVNSVTEVSKMRLMQRMAGRPEVTFKGEETPVHTGEQKPADQTTVHPAFVQIVSAIKSNDSSYYPKLQEWISLFAGPHVVDSIRIGAISSETFYDYISPYVTSENPEMVKKYIDGFVVWVKSQPVLWKEDTPQSSGSQVSGRCTSCGAVFDYASKEDFGESEICDCGGKIELAS